MEDKIPKKNKPKFQELVIPIIPLERPEKEDLEPSKYSRQQYSRKVHNKESGMSEEWINFVDLVLKALVGQNVNPCMDFWQQY